MYRVAEVLPDVCDRLTEREDAEWCDFRGVGLATQVEYQADTKQCTLALRNV